jgi:transposase
MYTLGIDLHKRSSLWVLIDENYAPIWEESVTPHPRNISKVLDTFPVSMQEVQVALEPVAGWRWVSAQLQAAGMQVHIGNPKKIKLIAESTQKTDKNDARTLAQVLRSGFFPEAHRVRDDIYALRTLLRTRSFLVGLRTSIINRMHGMATTQGLHLIPFGNPVCKRAKDVFVANEDLAYRELHMSIDSLNARIKIFDAALSTKQKEFPETELIMSVPGVGKLTALTIVAEVEDFKRFPTAKHLASFAGLSPRQRSSGDRKRFGSITHQGSPILRTTMVEAGMRISAAHPELFAFITRLAPKCGKKKARVAMGRKLLCIIWNIVMDNSQYDSQKVFPISSRNTNVSKPDTGSGA